MTDGTQQSEPTPTNYRPSDWYAPPPSSAPPAPSTAAEPRPRRRGMGVIVAALVGGLVLGTGGGAVSGALIAQSLQSAPTPVTVAAVVSAPPTAVPPSPTTAPATTAPATAAAATSPAVTPAQPVSVTAAAGGIVADISSRVGPAVVSISSRGGGRGGIGSGFVIDNQGFILTNNHVVQGSTSLQVSLADGTSLPATIVGTAPGNDLALIKIEPPAGGLTVARLGDSDAVVAGELAVAIGSPSGLEQTVTSGIVSSTGRTYGGGNQRPLRGLIQTDAAINPGNSGGPLLNGNGEVIGINTLKAPDTQGIGFAVPINTAKRLLPQLRTGGRLSSPYLGISGRALNAQVAQALKLPTAEGVVIVSVVEGGPAATAGIRGGNVTQGDAAGTGGDVITAIDGQPVRRVEDIGAILDTRKVGDTVTVTVARGDQTRTVSVVLAEWPNS